MATRDQGTQSYVDDRSNAARALVDDEAELLIERRPAGVPGSPRPSTSMPYFIRDTKGLVRIDLADLHFLQADGNYVEVHFDTRRVVLRRSLTEVLKLLPEGALVQINRSQAVNTSRIEHIGTDSLAMGEQVFFLSNLYRENLLRHLRVITDR